jgi:hypothetical protein
MKSTLTATAIAIAMTAAPAASTPTVWQGDMFIKTASSACSTAGTNVGDFSQVIFAPKGLPGNSTSSDQIAVFFPRWFRGPYLADIGHAQRIKDRHNYQHQVGRDHKHQHEPAGIVRGYTPEPVDEASFGDHFGPGA